MRCVSGGGGVGGDSGRVLGVCWLWAGVGGALALGGRWWCVGGGGGVGGDSGRVLVVCWLWAGVGGVYCCEEVLIRAKTPNQPNHPNQSNQPKNPESPESAKDRESPESPKKHEAPASPESPRKRHLLLKNGFSTTCSGTFKHPSLLEAGEDFGRGAVAVLAGCIVAGEC